MANDVGGPIMSAHARSAPLNASPRANYTGGIPVKAVGDGTNSTPVITETYISEITSEHTCLVTGFAVFNGSVASGNLNIILYDVNGNVVIKSGSVAMVGTTAFQRVPFTKPIVLPAGTYYVGLQFDNTTARFVSHAVGNHGQVKKTGETFNVATKITAPTTFTANVGPLGGFY